MNKRILNGINTTDFNDMRAMLYELEQRLLTVDPMRQIRFYSTLQNRIYEMLQDAEDETNILLYPETNPLPINHN